MIRIILDEADPSSAQDIQSRLQRVSYDVVATTATVDDAIIRANDLNPDLILMDNRMNGEWDSIDPPIVISFFRFPLIPGPRSPSCRRSPRVTA
ncbi:MAG: hypothetical protein WCB79_10480 [Halobacteriota archaeon]